MIYDRESLITSWRTAANSTEPFKPYDFKNFACKCKNNCSANTIDQKIIDFLNYLFEQTKTMYKINSGCRCEKHNAFCKGKPNSDHISNNNKIATACDIATPTLNERSLLIYHAFRFDIPRVIVYPKKNFIHISTNTKLTCPLLIFNINDDII